MINEKIIRQPVTATGHELRKYRKDREDGLKIFIEARLLNNAFMEDHSIEEVKQMAIKFDKKKGADFDSIWNETLSLVNKVKSEKMIVGKKWPVKFKHSDRKEQMRLYLEMLLLNQLVKTHFFGTKTV